jgi:hypothetical protein
LTRESIFVIWAFIFQAVLIAHFALRKWAFGAYTLQWGWIVYALSLPALGVSWYLWKHGAPWALWAGGILYFVFASFGFTVEYLAHVTTWRSPVVWPIMIPYVLLYLATVMFDWWPVGILSRPLWFIYAGLFLLSTWLNVSSH